MNSPLIIQNIDEFLSALQTTFNSFDENVLEKFDLDKLFVFYNFLDTNKEFFFSKKDTSQVFSRHFVESIYYTAKISSITTVSRETSILDFGTGPGLPGFLFACFKENPNLCLLDSQKRKLNTTEKFYQSNPIYTNIFFEYKRIEDCDRKFDIICTRATIPFPWSAELVAKNMEMKKSIFFPFIGKFHGINSFIQNVLDNNGLRLLKPIELKELDFLGMRHILYIIKESNQRKGFPRKWDKINKEIQEINGKSNID